MTDHNLECISQRWEKKYMNENTISQRQRKLSTILAMDAVNYTAKMGADEEGTLEQLALCREIIKKAVTKQQGRIFNIVGDAFTIEFASSAQTALLGWEKLRSTSPITSSPSHGRP